MKTNPDCKISVTHSKRGWQVIQKRWGALCYEYLVPFGGMELVKKVFEALLEHGHAEVSERNPKEGKIELEIVKGQSLQI